MVRNLSRRRYVFARSFVLLSVLIVALGCTPPSGERTLPTAAVNPTRVVQPSATPAQPTPPPLTTVSLVWWTPEFLSPNATQPAGPEIKRQLDQFTAAQQGKIRIEPVLKARYGQGGLLDYLLNALRVAPGVLPDVVVLDVAELQQASDAGLLQPLDDLLDAELRDGLYPFAAGAGRFTDRLLAVQWMADFEHAAVAPNQTGPIPQNWDALIAEGAPYLFALNSTQSGSSQSAAGGLSLAALAQYLSAGGSMSEHRELALAADPLRRLLAFYRDADQAGVLPPNALELADADAVWGIFSQGKIPRAQVSARRFYKERADAGNPLFSYSPGWQDPAFPIARGWALAIITPDPVRQEAAAKFIAWLLQPDNAGAAATAVNWLPTSPDALATWPASPYLQFLDAQLATALPFPAGSDYPQVAARVQQAIVAVLEEDADIEAATQAALGEQK